MIKLDFAAQIRALTIMLAFMLGAAAGAQTAQEPDAPPPAAEQAQGEQTQAEQSHAEQKEPTEAALPDAVNEAAETLSELPPAIDLDDPALRAALEQKRAADEALADALRAQMQERAAAEAGATAEQKAKPSLIPKSVDDVKALAQSILDKVIGWLTSPSFLAQIGALVLAYFLAPILSAQAKKRIFLLRDPPVKGVKFKLIRDYIYRSREFLRAIMLVVLLAIFAATLIKVPPLGENWLVKLAQGIAVVFLLYKMITTFLSNDLFRKLAIWTIIPLALLAVFGYFDDLTLWLNATELTRLGDTPITLMTIIRLMIFGAIFFKLGSISNDKGQTAIRAQEGMDISTREVVAKMFQIVLFIVIAMLVLTAAKVPLGGLVVIFSALSLGIGLGLQPIASNFVSGMIILFDRSVKVGDFVVLPDGQEGFVEAINMRSTTVETTDGKDIMVPNTQFTEQAYENWTHKDPSQRYEVEFTVAYDTDLDALEGIIMPAILAYDKVLTDPEMPDLEFRSFGENGINMAIEFWCNGVDDGPNKFTSDVGYIIWRTLKANKIEIPFPQRVVRNIK